MSTVVTNPARPTFLFLTLCAALPMLAHADNSAVVASSTASLSNVSIQLIDLDPNDNIAPAITFTSVGILAPDLVKGDWWSHAAPVTYDGPGYTGSLLPSTNMTYDNGHGGVVTGTPNSISVTSSITLGQLMANASPMQAGAWNSSGSAQASTSLNDPSIIYLESPSALFTLTPNTAVVIKGTATLSSILDAAPIAEMAQATNSTWGLSRAWSGNEQTLHLSLSTAQGFYGRSDRGFENLGSGTTTSSVSLSTDYMYSYDGLSSQDASGTQIIARNYPNDIGVSYANLTGEELNGVVVLSLTALDSVYASIKPPIDPMPSIPEPSTYALMGLGLVGIGLATRRRR